MSRGILDTSVLIATNVDPIPGDLAVSVISLAELRFGVLVAKSLEARTSRLIRLGIIQRTFDALPVDEAVADSYARLAARLAGAGRKVRPRSMDLLIAATAHAHGGRVYTRNAADLAGLEGLVEVVTV